MSKTSENHDQKRLSQLQLKRADRRRHADFSVARIALGVVPILVPCELAIVVGETANMPAVKANELAEGAYARIVADRSVRVGANTLADGFERGLPEQAIDERCR